MEITGVAQTWEPEPSRPQALPLGVQRLGLVRGGEQPGAGGGGVGPAVPPLHQRLGLAVGGGVPWLAIEKNLPGQGQDVPCAEMFFVCLSCSPIGWESTTTGVCGRGREWSW